MELRVKELQATVDAQQTQLKQKVAAYESNEAHEAMLTEQAGRRTRAARDSRASRMRMRSSGKRRG